MRANSRRQEGWSNRSSGTGTRREDSKPQAAVPTVENTEPLALHSQVVPENAGHPTGRSDEIIPRIGSAPHPQDVAGSDDTSTGQHAGTVSPLASAFLLTAQTGLHTDTLPSDIQEPDRPQSPTSLSLFNTAGLPVQDLMCVDDAVVEQTTTKTVSDSELQRRTTAEDRLSKGKIQVLRPPLKDCTNLPRRLAPPSGHQPIATKGHWKRQARLAGQLICNTAQQEQYTQPFDNMKRSRLNLGDFPNQYAEHPGKKHKVIMQSITLEHSEVVYTSRDWSQLDQ